MGLVARKSGFVLHKNNKDADSSLCLQFNHTFVFHSMEGMIDKLAACKFLPVLTSHKNRRQVFFITMRLKDVQQIDCVCKL